MTPSFRRPLAMAAIASIAGLAGWMTFEQFFRTSTVPFHGEASGKPPVFIDRTADFDITAPHRQGDEHLTGLDESLGSGACAFDYDGDGWTDLFLVNGTGDTRFYGRRHWWQEARGHRLLRNINGQHFTDITAQAGITLVSHGMGCVTADFDNDGHVDILVTSMGANALLRNLGNGRFEDVSATSGLEDTGWHTAAAVGDVDGDGKLDLYIGGFIAFEKKARTYEPGSQFRQDVPVFFNSALYEALPNRLYRNLGGLRFEDVTATAGVDNSDGRTLAALFTDIDDDRRMDLLVLNATGTGSSTAFLNRGNWRFEPLGVQARFESGLAYRGIAAGDLDNDGHVEFMLTGAAGHQTVLLFREPGEQDGGVRFADRARPWQLIRDAYAALSPWSPALADFNNDGWTDAFIVNGQVLPDADAPHVTVGQPKQLWLNDGRGALREYQPSAHSPMLDRQSARGLAVADFNNDGHLDVYVAHNNDLGQLLINEPGDTAHWLGVTLEDSKGTPQGVGARITTATEQGLQTRWVTKGTGFLSDSDARLHFGLGSNTRADLTVYWPDGDRDRYRDVPLDTYLVISRQDGIRSQPGPQRALAATAIGATDSPGMRITYFSALAAIADEPGIDRLLREALTDPDEAVRTAVVDTLGRQRSAAGLRLLVRFLDDGSDAVAARTVAAVCAFEEEDTTRFLLRAFAHRAAAVRQQTADCFTRYNRDFQDIKAVIQRKDLAAPYLAAMLDDQDTGVRIAAARALGASEEFRGVPPLIELLDDADPALQGEAVRALGLIRDRYALPALTDLLRGAALAPDIYARLFIALKRLDYQALDTTLRDFAGGRGSFTKVTPDTRLQAFLAVVDDPEGVVLPRQTLLSLAADAATAPGRKETGAETWARLIERSGMTSAATLATPLLDHPSPAVRGAAYRARLALEPRSRINLAEQALQDTDLQVRNTVLEFAAERDIALPEALLAAALEQPQTAIAAAHAVRRRHAASSRLSAILLAWLRDGTTRDDLRIAALQALGRTAVPVALSDPLFRSSSEPVRLAMLAYETARLPPIHVSRTPPGFLARYLQASTPALRQATFDFLLTREEIWAKQLVLQLLHGDDDPALRGHVLAILPAGYFGSGTPLLDIAIDRTDPLRLEALRHLQGNTDTETIARLAGLTADTSEDFRARVLAAAVLPPDRRESALAALPGGD